MIENQVEFAKLRFSDKGFYLIHPLLGEGWGEGFDFTLS